MLLAGSAQAGVPDLAPTRYSDFDHYTLAVTWQAGFCAAGDGCLASTPREVEVGLHGLWASRPAALIRRGVPEQRWWADGCDLLAPHTAAAPTLSPRVHAALDLVVPHLRLDLVTHEYGKHVACFGFDPDRFFATALLMRDIVVLSPFATWLTRETGNTVRHADAAAAFNRDFHTDHPRAVQFQCGRDHAGAVVLTQMWITIPSARLASFPEPAALADAPIPQDNCPDRFLIPRWER